MIYRWCLFESTYSSQYSSEPLNIPEQLRQFSSATCRCWPHGPGSIIPTPQAPGALGVPNTHCPEYCSTADFHVPLPWRLLQLRGSLQVLDKDV